MISPKLCQLLEDRYPIGSIQNVQTLPDGEWNQVIRLLCDKGAFVLLIPFMRCVRIIEVLFALQQASSFGLDEHVLHNPLSLENLQNIELIV
ncbi:MAG: hypothetical protein AAF572_04000 [Cyanobacteria bacterium P01_B01_bin.77]